MLLAGTGASATLGGSSPGIGGGTAPGECGNTVDPRRAWSAAGMGSGWTVSIVGEVPGSGAGIASCRARNSSRFSISIDSAGVSGGARPLECGGDVDEC